MPSRAYADRTRVPEHRSRADIEQELSKHQCERIAVMTEPEGVWFAFVKDGRAYRMGITLPPGDHPKGSAERRRRMRTLLLYVKARLNAVRDGVKSFDAEFMPERVMHDGRTLAEHAHEQIGRLEQAGHLPARLMLPGPSDGQR